MLFAAFSLILASLGANRLANVFLSYCRDDFSAARAIAYALEHSGHSVWWDREIKGGAEYATEIDRALDAADRVVVLWSAQSVNSAWVRDEAEVGRDSGRLVPASLDSSRPPLGFRQYQTIDLAIWCRTKARDDLGELLQAISAGRLPGGSESSSLAASTTRRRLLVGGGTAAAIAFGGAGWIAYRNRLHTRAPPEVESLMAQAKQLEDQNTTVAQDQAVALYERAVKLAPDYADAWGRLGLICGVCSHYRERPQALALRGKAMSSANQALQLDAGNVYGEAALAVAQPFIGFWSVWQQRMTRALAREPRNNDLLTYRAVMLQFEGRAKEAVPLYQRISEKPFRPAVYLNYIKALWTAGRPVELEDALEDAGSLYPSVASLWFTRFGILAYSGRSDAAISLAQTAEGRPPDVNDTTVTNLVKLAHAIGSNATAEVEEVMAEAIKGAHVAAGIAEQSIRNASALGRIEEAFELADTYYFARGFTIPDYSTKGSAFSPDERQTRLLFEPVTAPMRADPRFERLVSDLGFDRYWRESGVRPDYRRA